MIKNQLVHTDDQQEWMRNLNPMREDITEDVWRPMNAVITNSELVEATNSLANNSTRAGRY